ncbi:MAG: glycosyltransferase [Chthoniobacteraceae bacterium]|nr:glycosyltransferase [Chthoniobacteraceae bacterium]
MKVLLISHTCQSVTEGQPKAAAIAARLDGELLVLAPDRWKHYGTWRHAEPPRSAGYVYIAAKPALPWTGPAQSYLHFYPRLAQLLQHFRPDVIDIWEEPWSLVSAQACRLRNRLLPRARIISETEQNLAKAYPPPFNWLRAYTLRHADFAVARSREALDVLHTQGYSGPASVIPNAVDPALFRPMDRAACREALGMEGFVIGYAGRIVEQKGLMELVNALPLLPACVHLSFAGSGEYTGALQARLRELRLEARARFLPSQPLQALSRWMNAIDLLALPSRTTPRWKEQFGRVIIEAHACGTPVAGSDSGAIPGVVGQGGVIFPERNAPALAAAVVPLCLDPDRCRTLGAEGRRQILAHYTWSKVGERMHRIYQHVQRRPSFDA